MQITLPTVEIPSLGIFANELEFLYLRAQVKQGLLEPFTFTAVIDGNKVEGQVDSTGRVEGEYPFTQINDLLMILAM